MNMLFFIFKNMHLHYLVYFFKAFFTLILFNLIIKIDVGTAFFYGQIKNKKKNYYFLDRF